MSCHSPLHTLNINNNSKSSDTSSNISSNASSNNNSNNSSNGTKESMSSSCSSCSPTSSPSKNSTPLNNDSWNIIKNPVNGRTRISQACDRCRARKIKCSGKSENNPRCTNCEKDGFQCIVSDKLTRNSFPKGYTKNLEKKLLDVELDRNRILLELKQLKERLNNGSSDSFQNSFEVSINNNNANNSSDRHHNRINDDKPKQIQPVKTDQNGLINLQQSVIMPFNSFVKHLKINSFNGYENNQFQQQSCLSNFAASVSPTNDSNNPHIKSLSNYHMNLNRYLNLILYKLIFPLFNLNSNSNSDAAASSNPNSNPNPNSKSSHNSNRNLDHLIWLFFNDYNKLIPILDFELFYNDYLTFINNYTLKNSTFLENGEIKKRYHEFNLKDQDILIKLILILKFTLAQPKAQENSLSSIALPDKKSLNQLDESIKLINVKHLTLMFKNINFLIEPNLDKFEISLLMFYYLIKFENYNLPIFSDNLHSNVEFLRDVININKFLLNTLNINKSNNLIIIQKQSHDQLIKIQRLKLFWDYKILIKLSEIYFNCKLDDECEIDNSQMDNDKYPASLETIKLINNDIEITLSLVNLLNLIPFNIMRLVLNKDKEKLFEINEKLKSWKLRIDKMSNDDNNIVSNKLNSYYGYFKILINWHDQSSTNKPYYIDFVNLVYDLTLNNNNNTEISIETAENLCLHSFNFHFILLLSIIKLKNLINEDNKINNEEDKNLIIKLSKLIQLYQILVNVKDVDPTIEVLVNYIKNNVSFNENDGDGDLNQLDTLKLFTSMNSSDISISNRTSLFDKKSYQKGNHTSSNISFDLNAFHLPGDLCYSSTDDDASTKRRKSNASTSSVMSSNLSLGSRESSVTSARRISISSNDSNIPSLFPSATSPFPAIDHNSSEKKRRTYEFPLQLSRPATRVRSMSADSRRLRSRSINSVDTNNPRDLNSVTRSNSINTNNNNNNNNSNKNYNNTSNNNDTTNNNNFNGINSNICQRANSESGTLNSTNDLVSSILYHDDDLNLRMDRKSNNCQFPQILPTIPSEGNLFKAMSAVTDSLMDADSSVNIEVENTNNQFDVVESFFSKNGNDSLLLNNDSDNDFSKAFNKSPMTTTTAPLSMNYNEASRRRGPSFVDDDDLLKLKEKVMNMKTSIH